MLSLAVGLSSESVVCRSAASEALYGDQDGQCWMLMAFNPCDMCLRCACSQLMQGYCLLCPPRSCLLDAMKAKEEVLVLCRGHLLVEGSYNSSQLML